MGRIVKVISFPIQRNPLTDQLDDPVFEDEGGQRFSVPRAVCTTFLQVNCWYRMYGPYGIHRSTQFTFLHERNRHTRISDEEPTLVSASAIVVEVPSADNGDEFLIQVDGGSTYRIALEQVADWFQVGDIGIATIRSTSRHANCQSFVLPPGKLSQFPIVQGTVAEEGGKVVVHSGYRWCALQEALMKSYCALEDVGTLIATKRICGGAINSAMEYSINAYVWKVGREYVVDSSENLGTEFHVFTRRKDVDNFIRDLKAGWS